MGKKFQPFEAHIPHHLQFMIYHNLFGMDWMSLKAAAFRQNSWCKDLKPGNQWTTNDMARRSYCAVECDVEARNIENQYYSFGEASVSSLSSLWEDERQRRVNHGLPPEDVTLPASPGGREFQVSLSTSLYFFSK